MFRTISPDAGDPADDLIARLAQIRDARDLLTEDEYASHRAMVLKQIITPMHVPRSWRVALAMCVVAGAAMVVYGLRRDAFGAASGGFAGALTALWFGYGLEREYAMKRRLGRAARLQIVQRLRERELVAEAEGAALRSQIIHAFPAEAA